MELYDYQKRDVGLLLRALAKHRAALNAGDCGTGKTPVACEIVRRLNAGTLVVGPKSSKPTWTRWAGEVGTELDVENYEMLRLGYTPFGEWAVPKGGRKDRFKWHPGIQFLIFDEAHRCGGLDSDNAEMLMAARRQNIPTLMLSATPAETPLRMKAMGYVLRLHDGDENPNSMANLQKNLVPFFKWGRRHGVKKGHFSMMDWGGTKEEQKKWMDKIHASIFPEKGVRTRISDLGDAFPETMIRAELLWLGDEKRMAELNRIMAVALARVDERATSDKMVKDPVTGLMMTPPVTELMRAAQKVELLKVPSLVEITEDLVAGGKSVALFVRFQDTLEQLRRLLGCDCYIDGTQVGARGARIRQSCIERFQGNKERVIIANEAAGNESISLHDIRGFYPVEALFSCGYSARIAKQLMGRIHRAGGRSRSVQRFLFAAGTVEEKPFKALSKKLDHMGRLLGELEDSDFNPFDFKRAGVVLGDGARVQEELELSSDSGYDDEIPF